jgi:glycosyltransferase involved in cell wall biosynthesis
MDVSVVIPTCDRPRLLKDTVDSVLRQTVAPREIVIVDNGTNDDTRAMLEAVYGSSVIYLREDRPGVQMARNAGVARAQGTWIATLDDDDLRHPEFLAQLRPAVVDGRANLIYSDHRKFIARGAAETRYPHTNFEMAPLGFWDGIPRPAEGQDWSFVGKFPPERILRFNAFYPSTMLARRDLIQAVGGYNPEVYGIKAEDVEFLVRVLHRGELAIVWLPLVDYRIHETNSCGGDWLSQMIGRWRIFEYIDAHEAYGCRTLRDALRDDLPLRRVKTFDLAWRHSRFDVTDELGPLLRDEDWTLLRRLRVMVRHAPAPLRSSMMHLRDAVAFARGTGVTASGATVPMTLPAASVARPGSRSAASIRH